MQHTIQKTYEQINDKIDEYTLNKKTRSIRR